MLTQLIAYVLIAFPGSPDNATDIVAKADAKLREAKTLTCKLNMKTGDRSIDYDIALSKPNLWKMVSPQNEFHSDGKSVWMYYADQKAYRKFSMDAGTLEQSPLIRALDTFFIKEAPGALRSIEMVDWDGLKVIRRAMSMGEWQINLYYDPATATPIAWEQVGPESFVVRYKDLKLDEKVEDSVYKWEPPAGSKELTFGN